MKLTEMTANGASSRSLQVSGPLKSSELFRDLGYGPSGTGDELRDAELFREGKKRREQSKVM